MAPWSLPPIHVHVSTTARAVTPADIMPGSQSNTLPWIIAGSVVGGLLVLFSLAAAFIYLRGRKYRRLSEPAPEGLEAPTVASSTPRPMAQLKTLHLTRVPTTVTHQSAPARDPMERTRYREAMRRMPDIEEAASEAIVDSNASTPTLQTEWPEEVPLLGVPAPVGVSDSHAASSPSRSRSIPSVVSAGANSLPPVPLDPVMPKPVATLTISPLALSTMKSAEIAPRPTAPLAPATSSSVPVATMSPSPDAPTTSPASSTPAISATSTIPSSSASEEPVNEVPTIPQLALPEDGPLMNPWDHRASQILFTPADDFSHTLPSPYEDTRFATGRPDTPEPFFDYAVTPGPTSASVASVHRLSLSSAQISTNVDPLRLRKKSNTSRPLPDPRAHAQQQLSSESLQVGDRTLAVNSAPRLDQGSGMYTLPALDISSVSLNVNIK